MHHGFTVSAAGGHAASGMRDGGLMQGGAIGAAKHIRSTGQCDILGPGKSCARDREASQEVFEIESQASPKEDKGEPKGDKGEQVEGQR
jgi:hypothetical protein